MAPETRTQAGGVTEHLLRLLGALSYEGMPVTVLEAAGDTWVAATEVGRALGLHDNTVRQVVQKNPDIFESLTMTLEALWREGGTTSRVAKAPGARDRADTLFLNYNGVLAILLKLDTSRIKEPEARAKVVRFYRWALRDLKQAMLGRALPAGAAGGAKERPRLDARTGDIVKALARNGHRLPVSLLVPLAASIGIALDGEAIAAERAVPARPSRAASLPVVGGRPAAGEAEDVPAGEPERYLSALRRIVKENAHRIAGLEPRGKDGQPVEPRQGYIGGVGRVYGVDVVGILPTALKELLAKIFGQCNVREVLAILETTTVPVADPALPADQPARRAPVLVSPPAGRPRRGKALGLRYRRANGQNIRATHLCFRRDMVLGNGAPAGADAR